MRPILLSNKKGVTVFETLLVALIISLLMGGIFYLLSAANSLRSVSATKVEIQSEVRRAMDWIANDARQTVSWSIGVNASNPLSTHIKFAKASGYDTSGSGSTILGGFIEYTYDPGSNTITRADLSAGKSWIFRNIIQPPFFTRKLDGSIVVVDPEILGADSPMFTTGNLVIKLKGQKQVKPGLNVSYNLTEEISLRN